MPKQRCFLSLISGTIWDMTYFNRGGGSDRGNFGGGRSSGRPSFGGNRGGNSDRPEMHQAVCDQCGKSCQVPFRPNGSKPIFCSECFEAKNGGSSDRGGDRGGFRDSRGGDRSFGNDRGEDRTSVRRFERDGRPIENNFEKEAKLQARHADELANINLKLDKLINLLSPKAEVAKEEVVVKKAKKAKKTEATEVIE